MMIFAASLLLILLLEKISKLTKKAKLELITWLMVYGLYLNWNVLQIA